MKQVIYDRQDEMIAWAELHIPGCKFRPDAKAISLIDNGIPLGVCVFDSFTSTGCWVSVASDGSRRFVTREFLVRAFAYPFLQLAYPRLSSFVSENNREAIRFNEKAGFKREGLLRRAGESGEDLIVFGMLRNECRWLPRKARNGG